MSVTSAADFKISTANPSTGNLFKTVSALLFKNYEGTFKLESLDKHMAEANYWWCLEFIDAI